jgi:cold shock CspA family protein
MTDGRLVYFHRHSVVEPAFDALEVGDPVEVVVRSKESDVGPQASTVRRIGAQRFVPDPPTR